MSWLNLNESFNSLKGQITNFATEVLSEVPDQDTVDNATKSNSSVLELEDRCRKQELEIATLKKLNEDLQASLRSEKLTKQNGINEDETSWYWDPPTKPALDQNIENQYRVQIRALQDELSTLRERDTIDLRPDSDEDVIRLREENQNLTKNLEDLDNQHQQAMERLLMLKKELQKNFEVLKQDHEYLKNSNDEYGSEIKMLHEKLGERDKEIENMKTLKADYETLQHKYQNLETIYGLLRENAEKFQEENQDLHEEIFKLQEEVTKLEHELELATKHTEHTEMVPKEEHDELLKELNEIKNRRNANVMHHDEVNIDDNAKSVIEHLKREITELKNQLSHKESDFHENVDGKLIKPAKVMQLYNKYINFEIPLDYVGEIPSVGDNIVLYKLESVFKTVNSFKKEIDNLEHHLSEKNLNINHLQTQIDDLTTENDFLTTDIQHFEQELNEMKKNNDFLISEIAALKNASKLEPIIESHEDNLAKLENELDISNKMNKTFESEIKRIEKELNEVREDKVNLQESLSDLKTKYTTMLSEIEMCKNKTETLEDLETTVRHQEIEKLQKVSDEMDNLRKRLDAANAKNEQLTIDIHILENDKVLLTKAVEELTYSLEEKTTAHKNVEALKLDVDSKLQGFEHQLENVIKEKEEVIASKQKLLEKVTELEDHLNSTQNTTAEIDRLTTEKIQLAEKLSQVIKENSSFTKEKEEIIAKKQKLLEKVAELESQLNATKNTTADIERLTAEKTQLAQKINQIIKENSTFVSQIQSLQTREQDLVNQINNLKVKNKVKGDDTENSTKEAKDSCVVKLVQQQDLHKEIIGLQQENHKLTQRNAHLETELLSTDTKVATLAEEFNKLNADIDEKDELISSLNNTIHENKLIIFNLNNTVTELEQSILVKNDELERLRLRAESLSHQLVGIRERFNQNQEELHIVRENAHEIGSELSQLRDEMSLKNTEISSLRSRLEEVEKSRDEYQTLIMDKDNEIKELNQSITELKEKLKAASSHDDNYSDLLRGKELMNKEYIEAKSNLNIKEKEIEELKLKSAKLEKLVDQYAEIKSNMTVKEKEMEELKLKSAQLETLVNQFSEAQSNLSVKEKEIQELHLKSAELEKTVHEYKSMIDAAAAEKTELINLINLKHNESIQYHNEIQRLNHVLLEQSNEFKHIIEEKDKAIQNHTEVCNNCERLRITLKEKDEIIISLNKSITDYDKLKTEMQNASEVVKNLTEKCDNLDLSKNIQQEVVKKLTAENAQLSELEQTASKELDRLRRHLVETEENYTQELMTAEQKLTECQARLHQVEERAKQTTTVYTSNSIRANQEVETLRNQMRLVEKQRDEVQARLAEAEDARGRSEAALTNLQIVLEQFTLDKDREIQLATEKIRNKMEALKRQNNSCQEEIARLNAKLEESLAGLKAATRLGDQLESKTAMINDLKEQVRTLQTSVAAAEERYLAATSHQQDKVDKHLVKNLLINYVTTANNATNKSQVLRILSTVLDFNQTECERLGLARSAGPTPGSLAAEFVRFLQTESEPKPVSKTTGLTESRSTTPVPRKNSTTVSAGPSVTDPTHKRNLSTGSNNLLFANLDSVETASQVSRDSVEIRTTLDTGVTQTRNNEGAILKHVLRDM